MPPPNAGARAALYRSFLCRPRQLTYLGIQKGDHVVHDASVPWLELDRAQVAILIKVGRQYELRYTSGFASR
jgi:hypothetical protein